MELETKVVIKKHKTTEKWEDNRPCCNEGRIDISGTEKKRSTA